MERYLLNIHLMVLSVLFIYYATQQLNGILFFFEIIVKANSTCNNDRFETFSVES